METVMQHINLTLPLDDLKFFKTLVKKMGWTIEKSKKHRISNELTLKTIYDAYTSEAAGTVDTSNYDAFVKSILE
jgi:hypothetical protein